MNLLLVLSVLSVPLFGFVLFRMIRASPTTRAGRASLYLFAFLLLQLILTLIPVSFLRSAGTFFFMADGAVFIGAVGCLIAAWIFKEKPDYLVLATLYAVMMIFLNPLLVGWAIAGTDGLFARTVPLEQRLVSHDESIRKRAQQELLGLDAGAKHSAVHNLVLELTPEHDAFTRKWAAISLALVGSAAQEAIPILTQNVSAPEPDVAEAYRVALTEIGTPDIGQLPMLLESLHDPNPAVRCEAAASVARLGAAGKDAVAPLVDAVKNPEPMPACFVDALAQLIVAIPTAAAPVEELLSHASVEVRRNAATVLAQSGSPNPDATAVLLNVMAGDQDIHVRRLAARALTLRRLPPELGMLPALLFAARHARRPEVRMTSLDLLRKQNTPLEVAREAITSALHDSDAEVRLLAVQWLRDSDTGARFALESLLGRLQDPDVRIRRGALGALRRIGTRRQDLLSRIARAQRDPDAWVRCLAAEQLVDMGAADRVSMPGLVHALHAEDDENACAVQALGLAGHFNSDVVPAMIGVLKEADRRGQTRAALVLMQLGAQAKDAIGPLSEAGKARVPEADNALRVIRRALARTSRRH